LEVEWLTEESYSEGSDTEKLRPIGGVTELLDDGRQEERKPVEICATHEVDDEHDPNVDGRERLLNIFEAECVQWVGERSISCQTCHDEAIKLNEKAPQVK
jgi:hypothetical protein